MLNPEGHFPSSPGAHCGMLGSNRHSSSGNDVVVCAMALSGTRIIAVEYVKEPNIIIIKEIGMHGFLFCIYIPDYFVLAFKDVLKAVVECVKKYLVCQKQRYKATCAAIENNLTMAKRLLFIPLRLLHFSSLI